MPRETNIYQYWKAKQFEYPIISKIAKDYLAIPAISSTVFDFWIGPLKINKQPLWSS